jgi:hypothetical protein
MDPSFYDQHESEPVEKAGGTIADGLNYATTAVPVTAESGRRGQGCAALLGWTSFQ